MRTVSIKDAKSRLTALAREVEKGETVVVTRNGEPVFDMVPHRKKGGLDLEALKKFKREQGLSTIFAYVSDDFDDPLPQDFLIRPLPWAMPTLAWGEERRGAVGSSLVTPARHARDGRPPRRGAGLA
jgi:prevent-host-death family protein